jgi:hypothetical protein
MAGKATDDGDQSKTVAQNRRARHDDSIKDTVVAGLMLAGSEVKSLRRGQARVNAQRSRQIPSSGLTDQPESHAGLPPTSATSPREPAATPVPVECPLRQA